MVLVVPSHTLRYLVKFEECEELKEKVGSIEQAMEQMTLELAALKAAKEEEERKANAVDWDKIAADAVDGSGGANKKKVLQPLMLP